MALEFCQIGGISFTFRKLGDPRDLESDWCDLEARADASFFLSWDWIGGWLATIDNDVIVLEGRIKGRIVALGLLCHARRGLLFLKNEAVYLNQTGDPDADGILIEYNGLLLDRTVMPGGALQALQALVDGNAVPCDELFLAGVTDDFAAAIVEGNFVARLLSRAPTICVNLAALRANEQDYLDQRSANTRFQIRRSIRRYEERGPLQLEVARDLRQGLEFYEEMAKLHQHNWTKRGHRGAFASSFFTSFHRRVIETSLPKGNAELLRLSVGGTPIGYLYNFIYRKTVSYYASGFLYEHDNQLKPGLVAHTKCIERHLAGGMDCYDFLAGAARYKTSLGEVGSEISSYVLEKPSAKYYFARGLRWMRGAQAPS